MAEIIYPSPDEKIRHIRKELGVDLFITLKEQVEVVLVSEN